MNRRTMIAVAISLGAMLSVALPPMLTARTGTVAYLETQKMDPRALFRGDYVILGYLRAQNIVPNDMARQAADEARPVYVTFTTERPGSFVSVSLDRPELADGQVCIAGRVRRFRRQPDGAESRNFPVDFPQIAQYFVTEGEGRELEQQRGEDLLARVAVSRGCNAVLLGLEPR